MARTHRDIEAYLTGLGQKYDEIGDLTYRIEVGENMPPIALRISGDVVLLRALIGEVPDGSAQMLCGLFRKLLELNTQELVHSAYGLDGKAIQLAAALPMTNLDMNELEAVLGDMGLALARHVRSLRELCKG
jgi:hypothetical protein